jgi:predicted DNA-binding transcriptional regulator YafY
MRQLHFLVQEYFRRMLTTSARLLELLAQLQLPADNSGPALARRYGVSVRTVRNDVAALRELGYPVEGRPGVAGGYRLGAGTRLPPLLLDEEEAVAIGLGLTIAANSGIEDAAGASLRALVKFLGMLPAPLRRRLEALTTAAGSVPGQVVPVAATTLEAIAAAVRDSTRVRFEYQGRTGVSHREAEPYRLLLRGGRWYLLAWDIARDDWRSFRVDRMRLKTPGGRRFTTRAAPEGGFEAFLTRAIETMSWADRYRVRLSVPADHARARAPLSVQVEPDGPDACIVTVGSESPAAVARYLSWWEAPFEVLDSPELLAEVRVLAERYGRAAR